MTEITLHRKYRPLRDLATRYAIVTGGRGSGKSFAIATLIIAKALQWVGKTILFTRYTLTNAETSIMPEFLDKIDRCGLGGVFRKSGNDIVCTLTGTRILFRGIKTSTGINTAALKSIPHLALWVNDESEELVDETVFDTIDLSIRDSGVKCQVWVVLNPSDVTHFIHRKFFAGNGVEGGYNGRVGDVTYIHTTYLDNLASLPQDYIEKAEKCKRDNPAKYAHIWLGEWECNRDGLVYPGWEPAPATEWPKGQQTFYGLDWGFSPDPTAVVRVAYDPAAARFFVQEVAGVNKSTPEDVSPLIIEDMQANGLFPGEVMVFCDSANPAGIETLRRAGINAVGADKRDRDFQISWMRQQVIRYNGKYIDEERKVYSFIPSKFDRTIFTTTAQDGDDHFMDAIRYACYTYVQHYAQSGTYYLGYSADYE